MRFLASTKDMARDEWLRLRQRSIGGSEAAVVLGLNPYKSPFTLYHDKKRLVVGCTRQRENAHRA